MKILVSACLLGRDCKYSGGNNRSEALLQWLDRHGVEPVPVCPEVQGGLPTPRPPAEVQGNRVVNREGTDVTAEYERGAEIALETARREGCTVAVLKAKSPSCGTGQIYDGTFSGTLIPGSGVASGLLQRNGIRVYTEKNFPPEIEDCPYTLK